MAHRGDEEPALWHQPQRSSNISCRIVAAQRDCAASMLHSRAPRNTGGSSGSPPLRVTKSEKGYGKLRVNNRLRWRLLTKHFSWPVLVNLRDARWESYFKTFVSHFACFARTAINALMFSINRFQ